MRLPAGPVPGGPGGFGTLRGAISADFLAQNAEFGGSSGPGATFLRASTQPLRGVPDESA